MRKNVLIPVFLLDKIVELLYCWDVSDYCPDTRYDHHIVLWALNVKKNNCNPFKTFDRAVAAALSDEARDEAVYQATLNHSSYDDWDSDQPF